MNKKILIAEDDLIIQFYFKSIFKKVDLDVLFANDGIEAVNMYESEPNIDLVFMDISMPNMDGFAALEKIIKINSNAIVVMQTAHSLSTEKEKSFKLGCTDFLTKPLHSEDIFAVLKKHINYEPK